MRQPHIYTQNEIEKAGNILIYFAERIPDLSKNKLLKLIYFIEETAIEAYARPVLNLDFEVWQLGPVAKDLFVDLSSSEQQLLRNYIETSLDEGGRAYVSAKRPFDDGEFSDNEIALMDHVIDRFGKCTAKELVNLTHRPHSPWTMTAQKNGVLEGLLAEKIMTTDHQIDFSTLLDDEGKRRYVDHIKYLDMSKSMK
ncbi:Panacea domain-containing protein [Parapedobacter lycopersici]|uniref:Panacea domain-containing protein n=1 Tax=Parapedobacter lycopersici TaxID=1864939 RepID=UPI00214DD9AE|nr:Panacea domain-containing protein [Parapedobacter lycopersici]